MPLKIITTEDGSHSLFDEELNETYHSTRGALGESQHVFIKEGLDYWITSREAKTDRVVRVLEVGLGTGLNALLTAQYGEKTQQKIHFTSLEPFPIPKTVYAQLNYGQTSEAVKLLKAIHESKWEQPVLLNDVCTLHKTKMRLEDFEEADQYDIIYFDAFAPSKQPEVWSLANLRTCYEALTSQGILTTYCAQGQFKRNLSEVGFQVESLQGAMGKKEMVRALKGV